MTAARTAYETLEPFHVLAYFNPGVGEAAADTGLDPHAFYVGARGAPLGDCAAAVVTSAFYNFSPQLIDGAWARARAAGLGTVAQRRYRMLDEQLRAILGERADSDEIAELATGFGALADGIPLGGRPLAAGWAAAPIPDEPLPALWNRIAVLREWRGDNHITLLVQHGIDGIEASVFHEAEHPDPSIRRRLMGRRMTLLTRGWQESDWEAAIDRLAARSLVERTGDGHRLTAEGAALYDDIEAATDALTEPVWSAPEAGELVSRMRPYVKAVIDAGVLPGTRKKD
ncbi:SCO6745 family protein [Gordonia sp. VNK21]|uniref:SCO6745 family protein n=1 Tax=Gordonia sp. VNK21 TaxID=3382483 RepID=UPI0038D3D059